MFRRRLSDGMRIARESVHDEYGVVGGCVQLAPRFVGERNVFQGAAGFRLEVAYAVELIRGSGWGLVSSGPRV
jgi:hypothetical protein